MLGTPLDPPEEEYELEVLAFRIGPHRRVVQLRSEATGVASRGAVEKVVRGADDAHGGGRLVDLVWRELHHDREYDVRVLLRVLQSREHGHRELVSGHQ